MVDVGFMPFLKEILNLFFYISIQFCGDGAEEYGQFQQETECACRGVPKLTETLKFQAIETAGLAYKVAAVPARIGTAIITLGTSEEAMSCGDGKILM